MPSSKFSMTYFGFMDEDTYCEDSYFVAEPKSQSNKRLSIQERRKISRPHIKLCHLQDIAYLPDVAENGSYYGEISKLTGRPKYTFVRGYFRKDGVYVRSHYRS